MSETTASLQQLHRLLLQLRDVRDELDRGPRQIKARETLLKKAEDELAARRTAFTQTRAAADRKSLDLKSNESKIAGLQAKLNAATTNREFDIIRGQIDADRVANSVLEDEILEVLDNVDRLQAEIGEAEHKLNAAREELRKKTDEVGSARSGLQQQAADLEQQIAQKDVFLTGDARLKYNRLVATYSADALAQVDGKICTSCYTSVTPQQKVLLNSGQIVFCSCGRLLYLPESRPA
jgi:uncharacterized protein